METLVTIIHVLVALFMILVVLVQGGNSGGVGAAFGGGNSAGVFGATGATSFFGKLTYAAAAIFMTTSILLIVLGKQGGDAGLTEGLKQKSAASSVLGDEPAAPEADEKPAE